MKLTPAGAAGRGPPATASAVTRFKAFPISTAPAARVNVVSVVANDTFSCVVVVTPFSVVQVQPVLVIVGPPDADPLGFPQQWLLSTPNEYQDGWGRLFVSDTLAWAHDAWLLGLAGLLLAAAVPAGRLRRLLLLGGLLVAVVGAAVQVRVIP